MPNNQHAEVRLQVKCSCHRKLTNAPLSSRVKVPILRIICFNRTMIIQNYTDKDRTNAFLIAQML